MMPSHDKSSPPVLALKGVGKTYHGAIDTPVLFDVSFALHAGEFAAIVGASGSGKTTLLNLIGLLDSPSCGEIDILGRPVASLSENERADLRRDQLGFIFQFHYLLPEFTVLENALMPCRLKGRRAELEAEDRMRSLLEAVGLAEKLDRYPHELSGGQQQRVAVVRALANDPALVLADEPTGNLDSKSGLAVFELMRFLSAKTGKAFLMVTHDEHFAAEAERRLYITDGRLHENERLDGN